MAGSFLSACIGQALAQPVKKSVVPRGGKRRVGKVFGLAAENFLLLRSFDIARSVLRQHLRLTEDVRTIR